MTLSSKVIITLIPPDGNIITPRIKIEKNCGGCNLIETLLSDEKHFSVMKTVTFISTQNNLKDVKLKESILVPCI